MPRPLSGSVRQPLDAHHPASDPEPRGGASCSRLYSALKATESHSKSGCEWDALLRLRGLDFELVGYLCVVCGDTRAPA